MGKLYLLYNIRCKQNKLIVCDGKLLIVDFDVDDGSFHRNHIGFDGHNGFVHKALTEMAKKVGFKNVT